MADPARPGMIGAMDVATVSFTAADAPEAFARSLQETGFAVVVDHPIAWDLVRRVHADWAAFFASPDRFDWLAGATQDGYYPPDRSETAVGAEVPDLKEFFHWYPWGRKPFEGATAELHRRGTTLATELLRWIEAQLPRDVRNGLEQSLSSMLEGSTRTMVRVVHYPPLTGDEPPGALRAAAHEDINFLTLLPAATGSGLEVLDRDGSWMRVDPDPGALIVNVGDGLQLSTRRWFRSTSHRVVNPSDASTNTSRISTPLFLHPADGARLGDGWTALAFLQERIRAIRGDEIE
jgi:isopenicillin N synthase-like dioxygenase